MAAEDTDRIHLSNGGYLLASGEGGRPRHRDFVNFLATDKVPDSIFGIPVVQDESQYTEKDIEFFRRNPKAAGFYDLGDEGGKATEAPTLSDSADMV